MTLRGPSSLAMRCTVQGALLWMALRTIQKTICSQRIQQRTMCWSRCNISLSLRTCVVKMCDSQTSFRLPPDDSSLLDRQPYSMTHSPR